MEQVRLHKYKKQVIEELKMNIKSNDDAQGFQGILDRIMMHGLSVYNYDFVDNYDFRQYIDKIQYDGQVKCIIF